MSNNAVHCAVKRQRARISGDIQKQNNFPHRQSADILCYDKCASTFIDTSDSWETQSVSKYESAIKIIQPAQMSTEAIKSVLVQGS
jgi:hypothetical protein